MRLLFVLVVGACLLGSWASQAMANSLFDESKFESYTEDKRARRVGDVLTVIVLEQSKAKSSVNTRAGRETGFEASTVVPGASDDYGFGIGMESDGGGSSQRENQVRAQLTVTVVEVVQEGALLKVEGEQVILVEDEEQRIRITGVVRKQDIASNNTVLSTRLADAKVDFTGKGVLDDSQRPGLLYRVMAWLGLV